MAAVVEGILGAEGVVVSSLAHAVHDDGAVDYLGEGADSGTTRQVSMEEQKDEELQ